MILSTKIKDPMRAHLGALILIWYGTLPWKRFASIRTAHEVAWAAFKSKDGSDYPELALKLLDPRLSPGFKEMLLRVMDEKRDPLKTLDEVSAFMRLVLDEEMQINVIETYLNSEV